MYIIIIIIMSVYQQMHNFKQFDKQEKHLWLTNQYMFYWPEETPQDILLPHGQVEDGCIHGVLVLLEGTLGHPLDDLPEQCITGQPPPHAKLT